jgi:sugar/nucleoside kinase (ribokinase family)
MFAGAFLYGLTHGMSYHQAGELASTASAKIVTQYGPRLQDDQTQALLNTFKAGN